jgi:hypothetical protein
MLLVLAGCLGLSCSDEQGVSQRGSPTYPYLPVEEDLAPWTARGPAKAYEGEGLFLYIDGGADIYHEYGFERVVVQRYGEASGKKITLEIYEMEDEAAAFGIYSLKRGEEGASLDVGNEGVLHEYYLRFWKGPFMVTLTGFDDDILTRNGIITIAERVSDRLSAGGTWPAQTKWLAPEGMIPGTVRYLAGPLGLYNTYPFFPQDVFRFDEAVAADYEEGVRAFVIAYGSSQVAKKALGRVEKAITGSSSYRQFSKDTDLVMVQDGRDQWIILQVCDTYLLAITGAASLSTAKPVFMRMFTHLLSTRNR